MCINMTCMNSILVFEHTRQISKRSIHLDVYGCERLETERVTLTSAQVPFVLCLKHKSNIYPQTVC